MSAEDEPQQILFTKGRNRPVQPERLPVLPPTQRTYVRRPRTLTPRERLVAALQREHPDCDAEAVAELALSILGTSPQRLRNV